MVSLNEIRNAKTRRYLLWLERQAKKEKEEICSNPNYKKQIQKRTKSEYIKKLKLISKMKNKVKE